MKPVPTFPIPAWRANAKAGVSLAAIRPAAPADNSQLSAKNSQLPSAGLLPGLARIIRPEAQTRWMLPSVARMTPDYIEMILRGAMAGNHVQQWELFDLMEDTWPRLLKNLNEVKRAVTKLDWRLEAWAEDDEAPTETANQRKQLVSSAIWNMQPAVDSGDNAFEGTLYDLLDSWAKGTSVLELEWEARPAGKLGEIIAPRASFWVHPQNYAWSEAGRLGLVNAGEQNGYFHQALAVEPFPDDKFLVAICKSRTGHPLGTALLRALAANWAASMFTQSWFLNFAQIFGMPIRWASYDPNVPGLVEKVLDMLENMGSAAYAAFPAGTTLELKEPMKAGTDNPQISIMDRADKNCDLLILGQTLTTDVGDSGSRALGDVHQSVRMDVIKSAADFVAGIINQQLIRSILRLNFGDDGEAPCFCPEEHRVEDTKANAERDNILLQQGVAMPREWFYERHNIPLPQKGEETISGRAPQALEQSNVQSPMSNSPGDGELKNKAVEHQTSNIEHRTLNCGLHLRARQSAATEKLLAATLENLTGVEVKWLGGVKPFFRELLIKAQSAEVSDAEFIAVLAKAQKEMPELFDQLDAQALADALEESMSAALVNGAVRGSLRTATMKRGGGR